MQIMQTLESDTQRGSPECAERNDCHADALAKKQYKPHAQKQNVTECLHGLHGLNLQPAASGYAVTQKWNNTETNVRNPLAPHYKSRGRVRGGDRSYCAS